MKKTIIFASIACAGAFALHADWTYQNWFTAIGGDASAATPAGMDSDGGSWDFTNVTSADDYSYAAATGLTFDLDDNEYVAFNVNGAAPDTNTYTTVEVSGVFTPARTNDLPAAADMNTRLAQVGFAVGTVSDPLATNYYAWVGGDWIALAAPAAVDPATKDPAAESDLLVTFDYRTLDVKVSFAIITTDPAATNVLNSSVNDGWIALTGGALTRAQTNGKVAGLSCYGSGAIKSANGAVGLGYAKMDGVKYGSIADAISAAGSAEETIEVVRATSESATIPEGSNITISDPDDVYNGEVDVDPNASVKIALEQSQVGTGDGTSASGCTVKANASNMDQIHIVLDDTMAQYKEAVNKSLDTTNGILTYDVRTKTEIITNAIPEGGKALEKSPEKLHAFLATNGGTEYTKANPSSANIATQLETAGGNGLPLWQSYVMGIAPGDPVKPVTAAADTDTENITLVIPSVAAGDPSGDYEVKYKVDGGTSATEIKIPFTTSGTHEIKISLE